MGTTETWLPVPSCPGLLASSAGRLMVSVHEGAMPNGSTRLYGGFPTRGAWDGKRFLYRFGGRTLKAHRLICEAFNGAPQGRQVCMHLDEDSSNNCPSNLAWGSQKENLNAPGFLAYCKGRVGHNSPISKHRARTQP